MADQEYFESTDLLSTRPNSLRGKKYRREFQEAAVSLQKQKQIRQTSSFLRGPSYNQTLEYVAENYIRNGFLGNALVYIAGIAALSLVWSLILSRYDIQNQESATLANTGFNTISFILSFIYYRWLNKFILGYTDAVRLVYGILIDVEAFAETLVGYLSSADVLSNPQRRQVMLQLLEEIMYELLIIANDAYKYSSGLDDSGWNPDHYTQLRLQVTKKKNLRELFYLSPVDAAVQRLKKETDKGAVGEGAGSKKKKALREKLRRILKDNTMITESVHHPLVRAELHGRGVLALNMAELYNNKCLANAEYIEVNTALRALTNHLKEKDLAANVYEPKEFDQLMFVTLFIYLFLWIPFHLFISCGFYIVIFYPIIIWLLTGYVLIRRNLGNPFRQYDPTHNNHRRYSTMVPDLSLYLQAKIDSLMLAVTVLYANSEKEEEEEEEEDNDNKQ